MHRRDQQHGGDDQNPVGHRQPQPGCAGDPAQQGGIRRQHGILCQHQFRARADIHDSERRQQRQHAQADDRQSVDRAHRAPDREGDGNRRAIRKAGVGGDGEGGDAQAQIGAERQVDAATDHIGPAAENDDAHPEGEQSEHRRLLNDVGQVAERGEPRRRDGEIGEDRDQRANRAEAHDVAALAGAARPRDPRLSVAGSAKRTGASVSVVMPPPSRRRAPRRWPLPAAPPASSRPPADPARSGPRYITRMRSQMPHSSSRSEDRIRIAAPRCAKSPQKPVDFDLAGDVDRDRRLVQHVDIGDCALSHFASTTFC